VTPERIRLDVPPGFRDPWSRANGASPVVGVAAGPRTVQRLRTTYFDTEDLRIARWGCALRHRSGEGWAVSLPPPRRGVPAPAEIRFPGSASRPPAGATSLLTAYVRGVPVTPAVRLRTERSRIDLRDTVGDVVAHLIDDEISVVDGSRIAARFRQVEVEAIDGNEAARLDAIVGALRSAGAGEPTATPTYARALGPLAVGPPDVVVVGPDPDGPVGAVVAAAIASAVVRLLRSDAGVRIGEDPEAVHDARVATRRLRSDLRTYATMVDAEWMDSLRADLGWLGRSLGGVRDADVLASRMLRDERALPDTDSATVERLARRARRAGEDARASLLRDVSSAAYIELLERLVSAAAAPPLTDVASNAARAELPVVMEDPWATLRSSVDAVESSAPDSALHAVRITTKRVRYAAESMMSCYGGPARRFARAAAELQDVLGEHHDSVVASAWLRAAAERAGRRTAFVAGELAEAQRRRADRASRRWRPAWKALSRKSVRFWT
jgi:CHAD domain-containing protein